MDDDGFRGERAYLFPFKYLMNNGSASIQPNFQYYNLISHAGRETRYTLMPPELVANVI